MAKRISALDGHFDAGRYGEPATAGVQLELIEDFSLLQIAAWPASLLEVGEIAAALVAGAGAPGPGLASGNSERAMLRTEPLKWWLIGVDLPALDPELGVCLDVSHSRTRIRISGDESTALLNRHLPLDLREGKFPQGSVASTSIHHVGITVWRNDKGYELFIPRSFALSVFEVLEQSSLQFGVEKKRKSGAEFSSELV